MNGEELGRVQGGRAVIRIYCVGEKSIFNERGEKENICFFSRGPGFGSQHSCGNSQQSVTSIPGNLALSFGIFCLCRNQAMHGLYLHTCRQNTHK